MPKSHEKLAFGAVQPDVAHTAGPFLCLLYKLMTGHRLINLEAKRTHAVARSWHSRQRHCTVHVCVAAAVRSCSSRTSALARYVAAVLLSIHVDVHRGAAALRTNSYCTTTSSTSMLGILNANRKIRKRTDTDVAFTREYFRVSIFHRERECTN